VCVCVCACVCVCVCMCVCVCVCVCVCACACADTNTCTNSHMHTPRTYLNAHIYTDRYRYASTPFLHMCIYINVHTLSKTNLPCPAYALTHTPNHHNTHLTTHLLTCPPTHTPQNLGSDVISGLTKGWRIFRNFVGEQVLDYVVNSFGFGFDNLRQTQQLFFSYYSCVLVVRYEELTRVCVCVCLFELAIVLCVAAPE